MTGSSGAARGVDVGARVAWDCVRVEATRVGRGLGKNSAVGGGVGDGETVGVGVVVEVGVAGEVAVGKATTVIRGRACTVASMSARATGVGPGNAALTSASNVASMSAVGTGLGVGARPIAGCPAVHPDARAKRSSDARTGRSFMDQL